MSESVYSPMQMNTGFDGSMIDQLLETAEEKKEKEDDELEIERKYYQKPDTDPMGTVNAMPFLQAFIQGMQMMSNLNTSFDFLQDFLRQDQQGMDFMQEIPGYIDPRTGMVVREDEDIAKAYNKLIPESLRDQYKKQSDIDKYLKNIERLRQRGLI